ILYFKKKLPSFGPEFLISLACIYPSSTAGLFSGSGHKKAEFIFAERSLKTDAEPFERSLCNCLFPGAVPSHAADFTLPDAASQHTITVTAFRKPAAREARNLILGAGGDSFIKVGRWQRKVRKLQSQDDAYLPIIFSQPAVIQRGRPASRQFFNDTNFYLLLLTIFVSVFQPASSISWLSKMISHSGARWTAVWASPSTAVLWRCISGFVVAAVPAEGKTSLLGWAPAPCAASSSKAVEIVQVFQAFAAWPGRPDRRRSARPGPWISQGTRYLSYVMLPLCAGAQIYSLMYVPHKSWYSWTINSIGEFVVYAFGFLFMTPQLLYPWTKVAQNEFGQSFDEAEPSSGDAGDKVNTEHLLHRDPAVTSEVIPPWPRQGCASVSASAER
uniref:Lipid scramblase CLPTM1L n=1 Tax=Macrostomum lignano TaxID=282301 RepID=A0A1I8JR60_9PLAT